MKKFISLILILTTFFTACTPLNTVNNDSSNLTQESTNSTDISSNPTPQETQNTTDNNLLEEIPPPTIPDFTTLNDPELLEYIEDSFYNELVVALDSEEYFVENIESLYISKEYLEELAFNSQENKFFGYTLSELDQQFEGSRYVFTLDDDNKTIVEPFEEFDDTYVQVAQNVAIGAGVILLSVTVSSLATTSAPAVKSILMLSAKNTKTVSTSIPLISDIFVEIVKSMETQDFENTFKYAALVGSDSFKWGAITSTLTRGFTPVSSLRSYTLNGSLQTKHL